MDDQPKAVRLPGGNVSPVYRVGDTVRRQTGPWTPAVHALLRHLEAASFDGAPRVLGFDGDGREVLSYIDGFVPYAPDVPAEIWTDDALAAAARMVRSYHDAVRSFEPPAGAAWRVCPGAPAGGDIICHNDIAPWNTVYRDAVPVALIDWDFAAPAPAIWDVAYAAWRFVRLYYDGVPGATQPPDPAEQARRLRIFCNEYGLRDRGDLLDVVQARQQVMHDTVRVWGQAGVPGFAEMWKTGHAEAPLLDREYVARFRTMLASRL
jgi:hypothetical protein